MTHEHQGNPEQRQFARAKASVSTFIESLGLRPLDVGGSGDAPLVRTCRGPADGPGRHGVGNFNFALGVNLFG